MDKQIIKENQKESQQKSKTAMSDADKAKYQSEKQQNKGLEKIQAKSLIENKNKKKRINLVLLGHVDSGKSTLAGHLLYLVGRVSNEDIKKYEEQSYSCGKGSFKYAWIMDKTKTQRQRGITLFNQTFQFRTQKLIFNITSTPGLRDFIKNTINGITQSDYGIMTVASPPGQFQAGISKEAQTRLHAMLAYTFGIKGIIVCINKMDEVKYSQQRYEQIKQQLQNILKKIGYNIQTKIKFIPISSYLGDNLVKPSQNMGWYQGKTLLQTLDSLQPPKIMTDKPLRIPIQDTYKIQGVGIVVVGRIYSGVLIPGMDIRVANTGDIGKVCSIQVNYEQIPYAQSGDYVGIHIKGIPMSKLRRGYMIGNIYENPPKIVKSFTAKIIIIDHPNIIKQGYTPILDCHTAHIACKFRKIISKQKKGLVKEQSGSIFLKSGDSGIVQLVPTQSLSLQNFSDFPSLGRFSMRDMRHVVAVGVVNSIQIDQQTPSKV